MVRLPVLVSFFLVSVLIVLPRTVSTDYRVEDSDNYRFSLPISVGDAKEVLIVRWKPTEEDRIRVAEEFVKKYDLSFGSTCQTSTCVIERIVVEMKSIEKQEVDNGVDSYPFGPEAFSVLVNHQLLSFGTSSRKLIDAKAWDFLFGKNASLLNEYLYKNADFMTPSVKQKMSNKLSATMKQQVACAATPDICITLCTVLKDVSITHIQEWVVWHVLQGVRIFVFFDNAESNVASNVEAAVNAALMNLDPVVGFAIIPWYQGQQLTLARQLEAYKQCTTRLIEGPFESWAGFVDIDEYLFAAKDSKPTSLSQVLSSPTFASASALRLSWTYLNNFGQWWTPRRRSEMLSSDKPPRVCSGTLSDFVKSLVIPACIKHVDIHETSVTDNPRVVRPLLCSNKVIEAEESEKHGIFLLHLHFSSIEEWVCRRIEQDRLRTLCANNSAEMHSVRPTPESPVPSRYIFGALEDESPQNTDAVSANEWCSEHGLPREKELRVNNAIGFAEQTESNYNTWPRPGLPFYSRLCHPRYDDLYASRAMFPHLNLSQNPPHHSRGDAMNMPSSRRIKAQKRKELGQALSQFATKVNKVLDLFSEALPFTPCKDDKVRSPKELGLSAQGAEYLLYSALKNHIALGESLNHSAYWEAHSHKSTLAWRNLAVGHSDDTSAMAATLHFIETAPQNAGRDQEREGGPSFWVHRGNPDD